MSRGSFETGVAHVGAGPAEVVALLDHGAYFRLLGEPVPPSIDGVIRRLAENDLLVPAAGDLIELCWGDTDRKKQRRSPQ